MVWALGVLAKRVLAENSLYCLVIHGIPIFGIAKTGVQRIPYLVTCLPSSQGKLQLLLLCCAWGTGLPVWATSLFCFVFLVVAHGRDRRISLEKANLKTSCLDHHKPSLVVSNDAYTPGLRTLVLAMLIGCVCSGLLLVETLVACYLSALVVR